MSLFYNLYGGGGQSEENLDRPRNNFDVAGVPTHQWHSSLFDFHLNIIPSCLISWFCPIVGLAQIIIRAQIPLLIICKNAVSSFRRRSGYSIFISFFFALFSLIVVLIIILLKASLNKSIRLAILFVTIVVVLFTIWIIGHIRTAFKMKYQIPSQLLDGCGFFDMMIDLLIANICLPCSIAQMMRHVFQYDKMRKSVGCFLSDPTKLPPLEVLSVRPIEADEAGMQWTDDRELPGTKNYTGAVLREEMLREQGGYNSAIPTAVPIAVVTHR